MSEDKIIFKCKITSSIKDSNEALNVILKKRIITFKILGSLWMLSWFVGYIWYAMYSQDAFLMEAIDYFLSSKLLVTTYILGILYIWKVLEVTNWFIVKLTRIKRRNVKKPSFYIDFYETFYEAPNFDKDGRNYYQEKMMYSDITNFFITENLYIFCGHGPNCKKSAAMMRKDSFVEGTEEDFNKFIGAKINIK